MEKLKNNKILNAIIELVLIIIIIFLLLHNCKLQKNKNKKIPTGNVDIIEITCDDIKTCDIDINKTSDNKTSNNTTTIPVINPAEKEQEKPKEIEPETGLVTIDNYTVRWNGKKNLKIFTNSAYELEDVISPESSSTYKFIVKNKTNYKLKYKITFIETNPSNINMKYKLKKNKDYLIDTYTSYENISIKDQEFDSGENDTYYLDWKWISSSNDTHIGEIEAEYKLEIKIEAESIIEEEKETETENEVDNKDEQDT